MHRYRKILKTVLILYVVSQILFLINIQFPRGLNFDEFHYVPSAKQYLSGQENQNWEHPPLGKLIMAVGIGLFGDQPLGWRVMSTVFGSLTLVGTYLWALALFSEAGLALWVALLTLFNHLLYVQARIGMLDTFMMAFIVWALAAFTASFNVERSLQSTKRLLLFAGAMFGLGVGCKWFTVIPWWSCLLLVIVVRLLQSWQMQFAEAKVTDWYLPEQWRGVKWTDWFVYLGIVPVIFYFLTFIPMFTIQKPPIGLWDLFSMQAKMFDGQLRVVNSHPYMSGWADWPLMKRPIWYAFDKESGLPESVRGVILLGNPLIMWSGLLALLVALWGWIIDRRRDAFLVLFFYVAFFSSWVLIPRKVAFYYYYYPAGMSLSLALAYVFLRIEKRFMPRWNWPRWTFLALSAALFIYFFPVLAALKIPADSFRKWMWFSSWV